MNREIKDFDLCNSRITRCEEKPKQIDQWASFYRSEGPHVTCDWPMASWVVVARNPPRPDPREQTVLYDLLESGWFAFNWKAFLFYTIIARKAAARLNDRQECIPVGPPCTVPALPRMTPTTQVPTMHSPCHACPPAMPPPCTHPHTMHAPQPHIPGHTCPLLSCMPPSARTPPCRQTDACENITFMQLPLRTVIKFPSKVAYLEGRTPSPQSNFFHFHAVLIKNYAK